ncbi:MAG: CTP synthetase [Candidatus Moraniibacteriota bacterium]|nr:MAG: CTP synthetase [Candidatus Moranbacteria bacterium]
MKKKKKKYIFVVGGVMSGVGKGITTSAIAKIIQSRGYSVTALKVDPYINVDAGTMNPTEHGEVFVLNDGYETDQDMGNYERFLGTTLTSGNYMTTGSVYQSVIEKERRGGYKGKCVEVVPHIPLEIISRIEKAGKNENAEIVITEIGGTIGEYQNILFLEAARMLKEKNPGDVLFVLVSYVPLPSKVGEMKTKPTQYASRTLNGAGIQADIIVARSEVPIDDKRKEKIAMSCSVHKKSVISAPDVESIYHVPVNFENDNLSTIILKKLDLRARKTNMENWVKFTEKIETAKKTVKIGIVGKYFETGDFVLSDAYISVIEALKHASYHNGCNPELSWLDSTAYEKDSKKLATLKEFDGIVVPGGFGSRGIEGKINVAQFCRKNKIPYFGLCYGMQIAVIEYARHVAGITDAQTAEIDENAPDLVIDILPEQKEKLKKGDFGGSMRLGSYPAHIMPNTIAHKAYKKAEISERHRHRYEVNPEYIEKLEDAGIVFSGKSPNKTLMEIMELPQNVHPFFLATQFHPEFQSAPLTPHPLFMEFIKAAKK